MPADPLSAGSVGYIVLRPWGGPFTGRRPNRRYDVGDQPKMRPFAWLVALAKRSWTSAQLTTFQKAFT